jgi:hypothetical protein
MAIASRASKPVPTATSKTFWLDAIRPVAGKYGGTAHQNAAKTSG